MQFTLEGVCQCPRRAFLISTALIDEEYQITKLGQCPRRAFLISTVPEVPEAPEVPEMCQCPRRAFLISTVPSGNPHKHGAPRLIFACICPNILKTTVFQDIFVLFIICSYFHWIFSPCLLYNSSFADKSIFCRNCSVSDDSVYPVFSKPKARVLPQMKKFTRDQIIQTFF